MISANDISNNYIEKLFTLVSSNEINKQSFQNKILVNAFFEPSTRTALSFEAAMYKIGGKVITFQKDISSIKKGESFHDTIKTLCIYGDILVIRHPDAKKIEEARTIATIPVINAGNGNGEHPTQALLDLYTIHMHLKQLSVHHPLTFNNVTSPYELKVLFIGDIANSRTTHSLIKLLCKYSHISIDTLPYHGCETSKELLEILNKHSHNSRDITKDSLDISRYDVIYSSRLQRERSDTGEKPHIIIDNDFMKKVKNTAIIMHALPRNSEIHPEVDNDPRCIYFKQMEYGVLVRMGILANFFLD